MTHPDRRSPVARIMESLDTSAPRGATPASLTSVPFRHTPTPGSAVTMKNLRTALIRVVAGDLAPEGLKPWLEAFDAQPLPRTRPPFGQRPIDLLKLAVGSRDLALLNVVLDVPAFCPTEARRERAHPDDPGSVARVQRLEDRHGMDVFNGGIDHASAMPDEPWFLLLEARTEIAEQATSMGLATTDPLRQVPEALQRSFEAQRTVQQRAMGGHGYPDDYRSTGDANLMGLAVLLGWPDGLQAMLDHGLNPYAHVGKSARFASPLLLAGRYGETACATVLLRHASFKPAARYGYTQEAVTRLRSSPDDRGTPWGDRLEHGGFDLVFLLEQPAMLDDPGVRSALGARLTPAVVRRLMDGGSDLPQAGRQRLEQVVLNWTMEVSGVVPTVRERPRARL